MVIDFQQLSSKQAYFAMTQAIIPRPIAWVLSDNGDETYNLAPFSYFNGVTGSPPLLSISVGRKPDGPRKDTWVNIAERDDFVVHIPDRAHAEAMVASSATLPHGESELSMLGLETAAQAGQRLPRVIGPRVAMFCTRHQIIEVGDGPQALILGRITAMYVDDQAAGHEGDRIIIDPKAVDPVARLGGQDYVAFGEPFTVPRPR